MLSIEGYLLRRRESRMFEATDIRPSVVGGQRRNAHERETTVLTVLFAWTQKHEGGLEAVAGRQDSHDGPHDISMLSFRAILLLCVYACETCKERDEEIRLKERAQCLRQCFEVERLARFISFRTIFIEGRLREQLTDKKSSMSWDEPVDTSLQAL